MTTTMTSSVGIIGGIFVLGVIGVIVLVEHRPLQIVAILEGSVGVEYVEEYQGVDSLVWFILWFVLLLCVGIVVGIGIILRISDSISSNAGHCGWKRGGY